MFCYSYIRFHYFKQSPRLEFILQEWWLVPRYFLTGSTVKFLSHFSFLACFLFSRSLSPFFPFTRRKQECRKSEVREAKAARWTRTVMTTVQKFAINFCWTQWCRVGVIGFAKNFYVFSRHLHNVRDEHVDRLVNLNTECKTPPCHRGAHRMHEYRLH